ncbi:MULTISPECIES: Eco57I restriction-modification methylase domain-containing protein [Marinobacter]|uniref:Eco57I restriction-modification methylase domain-containing protein n=1 Tax=Marinobacter TaxID=2742 RepID=UPI003B42BBAC|nr:N-6 DNA methylase [Marinobacter alkaliphilus]
MASATQQAFESIRIVGGLLGTKILHDVRQFSLPGQDRQAYGVEPGLTFNDEIGRYWIIARGRWREFQQKSLREDITKKSVTVNDWLVPLLTRVLGYEIHPCQQKRIIGEREFPISHESFSGAVPMVLCGSDIDLDTSDPLFGQEGRKRTPMGLAQEYLNAQDDSLWAVVSNGQVLRLLRDNPAMTRPAYLEVDFARLFEEDNYADFATLWLLLHSSRLAPQENLSERCWLEQWREKGHDEGERALDKLRYGVADALRQLGTGFLAHPANTDLRHKLSANELSTEAYFQQVLRLVYRFLFLLTAEDRGIALLPAKHEDHDYRSARALYETGYSISTLRDKARQRRHYDHHTDAWELLGVTFEGYAKGQPLLAQPALGGLFAQDQCEDLTNSRIENRYVYSAVFNLCYFEHKGILARINYRDMDTEEFGSVYESLLELIPQLHTEGQWRFSFIGDAEDEAAASGHSRKLTGSYYTPNSLVQELIKSALEPVIQDRLETNPQNPREALLGITVCDPACGSGHFLLAAARRLATELAQIDAGSDQATENHYRHALRDVVQHCIYGVDINPLAVELCKTGLWLESLEPGKPLTFLNAHIRCGNSLMGVISQSSFDKGIPDDAYNSNNDDQKVCTQLKKQNRSLDDLAGTQYSLISSNKDLYKEIPEPRYNDLPEDSLIQVEKKINVWKQYEHSESILRLSLAEDLYCAAFTIQKTPDFYAKIPKNEHLLLLKEGLSVDQGVLKATQLEANRFKFFHWNISFPEVFSNGGFDVILGNPPWDVCQFKDDDFFSRYTPQYFGLDSDQREAAVEDIRKDNPNLYDIYFEMMDHSARKNFFYKNSGNFPLASSGRMNLYTLFSELSESIKNESGRSGIIVESGIATSSSAKKFFEFLVDQKRLVKFVDFENRKGIFPSIHKSYKFCLLTTARYSKNTELFLFCEDVTDTNNPKKSIKLSPSEIVVLNPNTKNLPVFRTQYDADLTTKIYNSIPVLNNESNKSPRNAWNLNIKRIFNIGIPKVKRLCTPATKREDHHLRVYESKMIHQFDSKFGNYNSGEISKTTIAEKKNDSETLSRNYIEKSEIDGAFSRYSWDRNWALCWRDICRSNDERTFISTIIPRSASDFTLRVGFLPEENIEKTCCLLGNFNSLVCDFITRQKIGGTHLSDYITNQVAILPPSSYREEDQEFINKRVIELVYCFEELRPFAEDMGYTGNPFPFDINRRHILQCELDAYYAKLYGLTKDELRYILDPSEVMGDEFPSETFRVLKKNEIREFGEYRTQRLVLEAWDKIQNGTLDTTTDRKHSVQRRSTPMLTYHADTTPCCEEEEWLAGVICDLLLIDGKLDLAGLRMRLTIPLSGRLEEQRVRWCSQERLERLPRVYDWLIELFKLHRGEAIEINSDSEGLKAILGNEITRDLAQAISQAFAEQQGVLDTLLSEDESHIQSSEAKDKQA